MAVPESNVEQNTRKPLNRVGVMQTGLQMLSAGTRRHKAAKKHLAKLGNEELTKELNRLIYEQEKFHKAVVLELRKEQKRHDK